MEMHCNFACGLQTSLKNIWNILFYHKKTQTYTYSEVTFVTFWHISVVLICSISQSIKEGVHAKIDMDF